MEMICVQRDHSAVEFAFALCTLVYLHSFMETVLQIFFVLALIILLILLVFQPKRKELFILPEDFRDVLNDYVPFYAGLEEDGKKRFDDRLQKFLTAVKINGANAEVE